MIIFVTENIVSINRIFISKINSEKIKIST